MLNGGGAIREWSANRRRVATRALRPYTAGTMPRDGSLVLSDVRSPTLIVVCEQCGRRGTYSVARLMEQHSDAKLTDLLQTPANCPKAVFGQRLP